MNRSKIYFSIGLVLLIPSLVGIVYFLNLINEDFKVSKLVSDEIGNYVQKLNTLKSKITLSTYNDQLENITQQQQPLGEALVMTNTELQKVKTIIRDVPQNQFFSWNKGGALQAVRQVERQIMEVEQSLRQLSENLQNMSKNVQLTSRELNVQFLEISEKLDSLSKDLQPDNQQFLASITSIIGIVGGISSLMLSWRQDQRDIQHLKLEAQKSKSNEQ